MFGMNEVDEELRRGLGLATKGGRTVVAGRRRRG